MKKVTNEYVEARLRKLNQDPVRNAALIKKWKRKLESENE